jgi:DnaK suppressor protein
MTMNTDEYKKLLLEEKKDIEQTLSSVSTQSTKNPGEWNTNFPDMNIPTADKGDLADEVEEFEIALGIGTNLKEKLSDIASALKRIEEGTFGKCEKGGDEIPEERLKANPAARTCMKHST